MEKGFCTVESTVLSLMLIGHQLMPIIDISRKKYLVKERDKYSNKFFIMKMGVMLDLQNE